MARPADVYVEVDPAHMRSSPMGGSHGNNKIRCKPVHSTYAGQRRRVNRTRVWGAYKLPCT